MICDRDWRVGSVVKAEEAAFSDAERRSTLGTPVTKSSLVCSREMSESERIPYFTALGVITIKKWL